MTIKRITLLQELLDFMGLGGRLHLEWISSAEAQKFASVVTQFTDRMRALGPNPLPGRQPSNPSLCPETVAGGVLREDSWNENTGTV